MIRQNVNIKGIKLKDNEILLSQFADDTTLYLDGSERSFVQAIYTLQKFSKMSGLNMNYDKTNAVWIGSGRKYQIRFMRDMNFCWDPGIFKVLGIKFCIDTKQIVNINYENKLEEIRKIFRVWTKRQLTPLGKITILKTLAISKITHLFITLPDPPDTFMHDLNVCFFFSSFCGIAKEAKLVNLLCVNPVRMVE